MLERAFDAGEGPRLDRFVSGVLGRLLKVDDRTLRRAVGFPSGLLDRLLKVLDVLPFLVEDIFPDEPLAETVDFPFELLLLDLSSMLPPFFDTAVALALATFSKSSILPDKLFLPDLLIRLKKFALVSSLLFLSLTCSNSPFAFFLT